MTLLEMHALGMGGARELVALGHGKLGAILVQLANCLLKELQLGDDLKPDDPVYYSRRLGIDSALVFEIFEQLKASSASIDQIASGS